MPFNRPTLIQLIARAQADLAIRLEGDNPYLRWSPERVLATIQGGLAHGLHGHLEWISQQIIPGPKTELKYLKLWAALLTLTPKTPSPATGNVLFTGNNGADLPMGTQVQTNASIVYETTVDATMTGAPMDVEVQAVVAGSAGNADAGTTLTLVNPVSGVQAQCTVDTDGLADGADAETAAELLGRITDRLQNPPGAGDEGDYEQWAREVASVTRCYVYPRLFGLGTVALYPLCDDEISPIPSGTVITNVTNNVASKDPVTALVYVFAATALPMNPTIHLVPDTTANRNAVTASLKALLLAEGAVGGNGARTPPVPNPVVSIPLSHFNDAIGSTPGITDYAISVLNGGAPAAVVPGLGQLPVLGTITWV